MKVLRALDQFSLNNHGLVTVMAAKRVGFRASSWYRALDAGTIELIHPGVARMYGSERTRQQSIAAAVLAAGRGAMASHRSAATLWRVPRPDTDPVDVILTERSREATLAGVMVHRPRDRRDLSPVRRQNVPCSNICRWTCDLGAVDEPGVLPAVGHILFAGLASLNDLVAAVNTHARKGRRGVPALRTALEEWRIDGTVADSVLERAMRDLVARYELPPVEFHAIVEGYEVDFLVVGTPVVLECDGWSTHGRDPVQFERDRERDAELTTRGYITVRFTYRKLTNNAKWVADKIRAAVERWRPA